MLKQINKINYLLAHGLDYGYTLQAQIHSKSMIQVPLLEDHFQTLWILRLRIRLSHRFTQLPPLPRQALQVPGAPELISDPLLLSSAELPYSALTLALCIRKSPLSQFWPLFGIHHKVSQK